MPGSEAPPRIQQAERRYKCLQHVVVFWHSCCARFRGKMLDPAYLLERVAPRRYIKLLWSPEWFDLAPVVCEAYRIRRASHRCLGEVHLCNIRLSPLRFWPVNKPFHASEEPTKSKSVFKRKMAREGQIQSTTQLTARACTPFFFLFCEHVTCHAYNISRNIFHGSGYCPTQDQPNNIAALSAVGLRSSVVPRELGHHAPHGVHHRRLTVPQHELDLASRILNFPQ